MNNDTINQHLISSFEQNTSAIFAEVDEHVKSVRMDAFERFKKEGLPTKKHEEWRYSDIASQIKKEYVQYFNPLNQEFNIEDVFQCDVPDLKTLTITLVNGFYSKHIDQITELENGIIYGSFAEALKKYPKIVKKHYAKSSPVQDSVEDLNTAFARDGIFLYIPDNVQLEQPIQIINIVHNPEDLIIYHRNLFILGKNAEASIVICEHSLFFNKSFVNSVTEVAVDEDARFSLFRIQNTSNNTSLFAGTNIRQKKNSYVLANTITLHGGFIRNNTNVFFEDEHCEVDLYGLYLCDGEQHVDNHTFIDHAFPNCISNEKYKGTIDNAARAVFSGKVLVQPDAQHTDASQSNNNMLLSDTAKVDSKPMLEIYADDVKCSHGATTGQLDEDALFYLRSRGIPKEEAKTLLMYAFASEIFNKIKVPALRERMDDLVAKRIRGDLSKCNHCMIKCS